MLKDVLRWTTSYLDTLLPTIPDASCCCTGESRDKPVERRDLVVPNEWDAYDSQTEHLGDIGDPAAVRKLASRAPGEVLPDFGEEVDDAGPRESFELRELMKRFVQEMIRGRTYQVVVEDGQTDSCKLSLARNLMHLQLLLDGAMHDIPLGNVKEVCIGNAMSNRSVPVSLDDLCSTLVLKNNECVTFRLSDVKERDEFTKCIKVLATALDR
mmetsp:Transcript_79551/g.177914  ORF Transcript_79551/g.177914 Transcript_79551/m.177914 type:complete len:212 (-) Transcript_79551:248-883(-)